VKYASGLGSLAISSRLKASATMLSSPLIQVKFMVESLVFFQIP
jgi:hypothetical protein